MARLIRHRPSGGGRSVAAHFKDVELAVLLTQEIELAGNFVHDQLGPLATHEAGLEPFSAFSHAPDPTAWATPRRRNVLPIRFRHVRSRR